MKYGNRLPREAVELPIPVSVPGQAEWGFEQHCVVGGSPSNRVELALSDL